MPGMTYEDSGVNYANVDPFKILAQKAGKETAWCLEEYSQCKEVGWSRGESCYLIEFPGAFLAHVEEGLGTKNLVADAMEEISLGMQSYYAWIAQCTVAMIVNDMATVGAQPLSAAMHLAVGSSDWFKNQLRTQSLVAGWRNACVVARCAWGGGETPTLPDIVLANAAVLSGSAIGIVTPKERVIKCSIRSGDAIVLVESSGVHANGLTLCRKIAAKLGQGYQTIVETETGARTFGEALLVPTHIYVALVQDCLDADIDIHYAVNITGHGWRKLMRAVEPFVYVIESIPEPHPIFKFIQENGPVTETEMYGNFNMGAGFALFVPQSDVAEVIRIATDCGSNALCGGYVEKRGDEKKVIIEPKNLVFESEALQVR